jgi:hypothetical protein
MVREVLENVASSYKREFWQRVCCLSEVKGGGFGSA